MKERDLVTVYKYLDVDGGLAMLSNSNLQFTNATCLNDPFDCHPSLIDFSNVPTERMKVWDKEDVMAVESNHYERLRDKAWVCSLSKVHDSILLWSYYCNHKGICVGIDREKAKAYLSNVMCSTQIGAIEMKVQYRDIIEKPDYFKDAKDYFLYQLSTKAKAWEHEQEVRLLLIDPTNVFVSMALPNEPKDDDEVIDWKDVRAYPKIGGECFLSLYLGVRISEKDREQLVKTARATNPAIKIYQMSTDPDAFRLKEELIEE